MANERKWTVYLHLFPNGKKYVGITSQNIKHRWKNGAGYSDALLIGRAINKYGWENIEHIVLSDNLTEQDAKDKEIELVNTFNSNNYEFGYNLTCGGDGTTGYSHSPEAREKMADSKKGRTATTETRRKMSGAAKLRPPITEETRERLSKAKSGMVFTDESRKKMSESHKGLKHSEEHRRNIGKASKGRTYAPRSAETREKLSRASTGNTNSLGYKHGEETRKNMSIAAKAAWEKRTNRSHSCSEEARQKMSEARKQYLANKMAEEAGV